MLAKRDRILDFLLTTNNCVVMHIQRHWQSYLHAFEYEYSSFVFPCDTYDSIICHLDL